MSERTWTAEQQAVIDSRDRNLLVSAAAGSGKTAVLVERILKKITDAQHPVDIDRLLVVTFTRAAAGEMRDRIGAAIEAALDRDPENEHLQRQSVLLHRAQITTIDGFCNGVVQNYFNRIGIDPGYRIADEGELKLLQADVLEELLEAAYEEADPAFLQFMDAYAPGKSDRAIEEVLLRLFAFASADPYPKEWLQHCLKAYEVESIEALDASAWMQEIFAETRLRLAGFRDEAEALLERASGSDGAAPLVGALSADVELLDAMANCESFAEFAQALKKPSYKRIAGKLAPGEREEVKAALQDQRDRLKKKVKKLYEDYYQVDEEQILEDLHALRGSIEVLIRLEASFMDRYAESKRSRNIVDFSDIANFALEILLEKQKDGTTVRTEAALELARQFEEVMIDEYQDSNYLQEYILRAVSGAGTNRNNRFMVGDMKQSIYGFRMAKPEIFLEKYREYPAEAEKNLRIDLSRNFRSRAEVLEATNALFRRIMIPEIGNLTYDDAAALYPGASYLPSETGGASKECGADGRGGSPVSSAYETELLVVDRADLAEAELSENVETELEVEALVVARRIKELIASGKVQGRDADGAPCLRDVTYRDIVILLRSAGAVGDIFVKTLQEEGIPAYATSKAGYFSAVEVMTVLNFLRILDNPQQDIPYTAILRSPMVGCTDEELAKLRIESRKLSMADAAAYYAETEEDATAEKLKDFLARYEELRSRVPYTEVHQLLYELLEETGYLAYVSAMPAGKQREANLRMLIEKAVEYEHTSYHGLFHFIRYIEKLAKYQVDYGEVSIYGEAEDAVRIMTIHKSKGLEFPIVFVSGLGRQFNMRDANSGFVLHADMGIGCNLVDLERRLRRSTVYKHAIQNRIRKDALGEELRVLYVAMTRAKEKLILTGIAADHSQLSRAEGLQAENDRRTEKGAHPEDRFAMPVAFETVYGAKGYLNWILEAVPESACIRLRQADLHGLSLETGIASLQIDQAIGALRRGLAERVEDATVLHREFVEKANDTVPDDAVPDAVAPGTEEVSHGAAGDVRAFLQRYDTFVYPFLEAAKLPAKMTVSDIKKASIETMEEEKGIEPFREAQGSEPVVPRFISEDAESIGGAARGTIYHHVFQCLNYEKLTGTDDETLREAVRAELARMQEAGLLAAEDLEVLQVEDFVTFLQSELGRRMGEAGRLGRLYREQPFVLDVSAKEIDSTWPEGENILVQGTIDAYFSEKDAYVLVDYKTDRVYQSDGSDLVQKYQKQLEYYAMALERITGIEVREMWIYAVTLGRAIRLADRQTSGSGLATEEAVQRQMQEGVVE